MVGLRTGRQQVDRRGGIAGSRRAGPAGRRGGVHPRVASSGRRGRSVLIALTAARIVRPTRGMVAAGRGGRWVAGRAGRRGVVRAKAGLAGVILAASGGTVRRAIAGSNGGVLPGRADLVVSVVARCATSPTSVPPSR